MTEGGLAPAMTPDKLVSTIVKLLEQKGQPAVQELQKRIDTGKGFMMKGVSVDVAILKDALVAYKKTSGASAVPTGASPAPPVSAAGGGASAGAKWVPPAATSTNLASRAVAECENAEPFMATLAVVGGNKVAVLQKPNVLSSPTGDYVSPDEGVEVVARTVNQRDGRVYLRLKKQVGWVCTRSRKDYAKIVIAKKEHDNSGGKPLEPQQVASRAEGLVTTVDEHGVCTDGGVGTSTAWFRAGIRCQVLNKPSLDAEAMTASRTLQAKDEFCVIGFYANPQDGRGYLRLKDTRGWVCERNKNDFFRPAVEPIAGPSDPVDSPNDVAPLSSLTRVTASSSSTSSSGATLAKNTWRAALNEMKGGSSASTPAVPGRKPIVVNRTDENLPAPVAKKRDPKPTGPIVYRSDVDIWPEELRPPRPIERSTRTKLRKLHDDLGHRVTDAEQDLKEVQERVDGYARACPAQKELLQYADTLKKELAKSNKEWAKAARELLTAEGVNLDTPYAGTVEKLSAARLKPAQVNGARWYCAMVRANSGEYDSPQKKADADSPESPEKSAACRHFGPLRRSSAEASQDLQKMKRQLSSSDVSVVTPAAPAAPASSAPKKARVQLNID